MSGSGSEVLSFLQKLLRPFIDSYQVLTLHATFKQEPKKGAILSINLQKFKLIFLTFFFFGTS